MFSVRRPELFMGFESLPITNLIRSIDRYGLIVLVTEQLNRWRRLDRQTISSAIATAIQRNCWHFCGCRFCDSQQEEGNEYHLILSSNGYPSCQDPTAFLASRQSGAFRLRLAWSAAYGQLNDQQWSFPVTVPRSCSPATVYR